MVLELLVVQGSTDRLDGWLRQLRWQGHEVVRVHLVDDLPGRVHDSLARAARVRGAVLVTPSDGGVGFRPVALEDGADLTGLDASQRWLRCSGAAEGLLRQRLSRAAVPAESSVPLPGLVDLLVATEDADRAAAVLGDDLYGFDLTSLAAALGRELVARKATVALAESCTGGLAGALVTAEPGASAWFLGGAVVYANAEKTRACGVPPELIESHGAVSEAVAVALAEGLRVRTGATLAGSITGVAGPAGGTAEKPVGTVWLAAAGPRDTVTTRCDWGFRPREEVRLASAHALFDLLRRMALRDLTAPAAPASPAH